ncbi:AAA family ATPase [Kandleria sp.]|uniref:ParA family protein n=1 Tax=Kandleria sp. TaxID=2774291 RepID=UPI001B63CEAB|nr:AAA family ATPase [Kandleria sp.]MBP3276024.1 AAA family ATPase [Kandleria sp.]
MRVISVLNNKGGVSKTTTCLNLAKGLSDKGKKVLLIDLDSQGNTSRFFFPEFYTASGIKDFNLLTVKGKNSIERLKELENYFRKSVGNIKDVNDVLLESPEVIYECIKTTAYENLNILPSIGGRLINTNEELTRRKNSNEKASVFDRKLKMAIRVVRKHYDYIIIDNAPAFNNITINALLCSDEIIIPLKPAGMYEMDGFITTAITVLEFNQIYGLNLKMHLLITMVHRGNRPDYIRFIEQMRSIFSDADEGIDVYNTTIGYQDSPASSSTMTSSFIIDDRKKKIGEDFYNLVQEVMGDAS